MRNLLMVSQVAGSLMLLIITGFIVLGFSAITKTAAVFDSTNLYVMSIDPVRDGYAPKDTAALFEKLRERLRTVPSIVNVAFSEGTAGAVFQGGSTTFTVPASGKDPAKVLNAASKETVGANYFATLGVRIASGREFSARDERGAAGAMQPAIVSQVAAEEMFGTADPIGRRILNDKDAFEIVGVAPDLRGGAFGQKPLPAVWIPLTKHAFARPPQGGITLMVRAASGNDAFNEIRRQVAAIDPNLNVFNAHTMTEELEQTNNLLRSTSFIYGGFGVFGLILASVGLAGVTAYSVAQRRKEIGIRMALGARRDQVLRLVLKEGATLVIIGSAIGLTGAWAIGRLLAAWSPEMAQALGAKQPTLLFGAPLLLAGLAMLACYFPARKSTSIDPLTALRQE